MVASQRVISRMHPALSVIFFTSVSGCGYGLLFLLAIALAVEPRMLPHAAAVVALVSGVVFAAAGLTASMLHLGKPLRAWRAFSQWRSSWLSREGVAAVASFIPALVLFVALWRGGNTTLVRSTALALALLAITTVWCTARIYTSLKTVQAWNNAYALPGYLLFALLGGAGWLWLLLAFNGRHATLSQYIMPLLVAFLAAWCALIKGGYWKHIDTAPAAANAESATGLGRFGTVSSFEAPHTQANYLTHEMGFVLARKHSARLRVIALVLFAVVPVAVAIFTFVMASPALTFGSAAIAALSITAGTFVERWLFFAEAKHVVMLYYGERGLRSEG